MGNAGRGWIRNEMISAGGLKKSWKLSIIMNSILFRHNAHIDDDERGVVQQNFYGIDKMASETVKASPHQLDQKGEYRSGIYQEVEADISDITADTPQERMWRHQITA